MANILGIWGQNFSNGTEELIAVWHRMPMVRKSGVWTTGPGVTLTNDTKAEMRSFLNHAFLVNGVDANCSYDGTSWSTTAKLADSPKGYFIENYDVRLYLGDVTIAGTRYPSRIWFSDLPTATYDLTWGLETGSDLAQTADSAVVTSAGSLFKTRNIKVGDPITITSGTNAGQYTVQSIDSETQLTLTASLTNTATDSSFWVGSNYFDVETDDGDTLQGFGKNSDTLLIYKQNSVHYYSSRGKELRSLKGIPGTTSGRSVVTIGSYTYHYHPSGIWRVGLPSGVKISNKVYDFIEGVASGAHDDVIGWKEKEKTLVMYLGDVTLRDGSTVSNCALAYDTESQIWKPRSYPIDIKCATTWLESNVPTVYAGDDSDAVYKMDYGNDFNDVAISFQFEDKVRFPAGDDTLVDFDKARLYIENGPEVQLLFKLYYRPSENEGVWINDNDWQPMIGSQRGEKCEWYFPEGSRACGVALKMIESSTNESFLLEKYVIYFSNPTTL